MHILLLLLLLLLQLLLLLEIHTDREDVRTKHETADTGEGETRNI